MTNSRAKGKRGELALCRWLESIGFGPCLRSAQVAGYLSSDVVCEALPGLHIECKWVEGMKEGSYLWRMAVEQTIRDSAARGMPGALFFKRNRQPWRLTIPGDADWPTWEAVPDITHQLNRFRATPPDGSSRAA